MRFKSQLSKTPGVILEKSEKRILHAAKELERAIRGVLETEAEANLLINGAIRDYQQELDDAAVKAGAKPVDSTLTAGRPVRDEELPGPPPGDRRKAGAK